MNICSLCDNKGAHLRNSTKLASQTAHGYISYFVIPYLYVTFCGVVKSAYISGALSYKCNVWWELPRHVKVTSGNDIQLVTAFLKQSLGFQETFGLLHTQHSNIHSTHPSPCGRVTPLPGPINSTCNYTNFSQTRYKIATPSRVLHHTFASANSIFSRILHQREASAEDFFFCEWRT